MKEFKSNVTESNLDAILEERNIPVRTIMVPADRLHFNKLNEISKFDDEESIESFADSLYEDHGVKVALYAYPDETGYTLISGERRTKATLLNIQRHPEDAQRKLPVIVLKKPDKKLDEVMMIETFNENRKLNDDQLLICVGNWLQLYNKLTEEGRRPKGQKRNWVAAKLSIGQKHAEKLIHILEGTEKDVIPKEKKDPNPYFAKLSSQATEKLGYNVKVNEKQVTIKYDSTDEDLVSLIHAIGLGNLANEIDIEE